ncbi:adaptin ear-binding coat-associated protein [Musa troglodytarum]|uniref:Adaptin ear-binding coat-associated protein n=1 Tax=Musa troglodytarum TaxID=320322 RepID=A0A9E7GEV1_9LILI|nr:adaptin ear-binding coat-associated protein [Musa troglodytarum]
MDRPTHPNLPESEQGGGGGDDEEAVELVLFHANECYVYLIQFSPIVFLVLFDPVGLSAQIPPRKSAASYRADEWNVNKWAWEGVLKVVSKGKECIIRLEDKTSGELYARAFLREGEPHPVEPVIDSSRERTQAYDFQAALHDHMKYLDKKKVAEEMEQHYQTTSTVDYSLKEGETLVLQLKNKGGQKVKSACLEQGLNNLSLDGKTKTKEGSICLKPPPPPPAAPLSPVKPAERSSFTSEPSTMEDTESHSEVELSPKETSKNTESSAQNVIDDDFGDFQAAG